MTHLTWLRPPPTHPRETCLLLHGFTGTAAAWRAVVEHLPKNIAALGVTLPGHTPNTAAVPGDFWAVVESLAEAIAPASAAARVAPARPLHLVGYSMGARVGLGLLVRFPHLCQRATLIGVHPGLTSAAARAARRQHDQHWLDLLEHEPLHRFVDAWQTQPLFASQTRLAGSKQLATQRAQRLRHHPLQLAAALRSLSLASMPCLSPALPQLTLDVTLIAGAIDRKFWRIAQAMAPQLPAGRCRSIPACGHNPLVEAPAALAALLTPPALHPTALTQSAAPTSRAPYLT